MLKHFSYHHKELYVQVLNERKRQRQHEECFIEVSNDQCSLPKWPKREEVWEEQITVSNLEPLTDSISVSDSMSDLVMDSIGEPVNVYISTGQIMSGILEMVTVNDRPLSIINDSGFMKLMNPLIEAINRRCIHGDNLIINSQNLNTQISVEAAKIRTQIKEDVMNRLISLKLDCVTGYNCSILGVHIQYVKDCKIIIRTLGILPLKKTYTGESLADEIINLIKLYQINVEQIYSITSDNGNTMDVPNVKVDENESLCQEIESSKNVLIPLDDGNVEDLREIKNLLEDTVVNLSTYAGFDVVNVICPAHLLNLFVNDFLKSQYKYIALLRDTANELRKPEVEKLLKQKNLAIPPWENAKIWLTTFNMLDAIVKNKTEYLAVLIDNTTMQLTKTQMERLREMRDALVPIVRASKKFQAENLTLTDFYLEWLKFEMEISRMKTYSADSLLINIQNRSKTFLENLSIKTAIYLDPRLKASLTENQQMEAKLHLKNVSMKIRENSVHHTTGECSLIVLPDAPSRTDEFDKYLHELIRKTASNTLNWTDNYHETLFINYDNCTRMNHNLSVLEFWDSKKLQSPELYNFANVIFGIPATQATVMKGFSALHFIRMNSKEDLTKATLNDMLLIKFNN